MCIPLRPSLYFILKAKIFLKCALSKIIHWPGLKIIYGTYWKYCSCLYFSIILSLQVSIFINFLSIPPVFFTNTYILISPLSLHLQIDFYMHCSVSPSPLLYMFSRESSPSVHGHFPLLCVHGIPLGRCSIIYFVLDPLTRASGCGFFLFFCSESISICRVVYVILYTYKWFVG